MTGLVTSAELWELVPAALGAVLGAVIGAVPTFLLARRTSREAAKAEAAGRQREARTTATTAMIMLQRITNSLYTLHRQIEEMISQAQARGFRGRLWQIILPMGGISPEPIRFDTRELIVLYEAKRPALANDMMLMSERHFTAETIVVEYGIRRKALGDMMDPEMNGNVGSVLRTRDNERRFGPRIAKLEQMATQMRAALEVDMETAIGLMKALSEAMQKHFDDPGFLQIQFGAPEGS